MNDFSEIAGLRKYPLARRGMMMTGLISGFTLAVDRVEAQTITTDANGLDVGDTKIPTSSGELPAYYARPAKGTHFPVVIVIEEIFGVGSYIRRACERTGDHADTLANGLLPRRRQIPRRGDGARSGRGVPRLRERVVVAHRRP